MKKFIKGRWFPLAIAVIIVAALLIFLCCTGFRITYNPALENSWDAVSAFAAWTSVIMSFVAVIAAGIVALRQNKIALKQAEIAEQQNKIALFEKRYEIYKIIMDCKFFDEVLLDFAGEQSDIYGLFGLAFDIDMKVGKPIAKETIYPDISKKIAKLSQCEFLFSEDVSSHMRALALNILTLVNLDILHADEDCFSKAKKDFHESLDNLFNEEVFHKIKLQLQLQLQ